MTNQQAVALTVFGSLLLCTVHFINSVYVATEPQQRTVDSLILTLPDTAVPYNADTLQQLLAQWSLAAATEVAPDNAALNALAGYDNTLLGDTRIALLAIYRQQQPTAVLALQQPGQPIHFARIMAGESVGDIQLSQLTGRTVTITRGAQQVTLRLFNPGSAVAE